MFIPRIWFDEVERIGKCRCTPVGYGLQQFGDLIGFTGLIMLLVLPVYLVQRAVTGTLTWSLLWLLPIPIVVGVVGALIVEFSWSLARRKQFRYDYERRVSTWIQDGVEQSYTFPDWQAEMSQKPKG